MISVLTAGAVLSFASTGSAEAPPVPPLVCAAPVPASFDGGTGPIADNSLTTFTVTVSGQPARLWDVDLAVNLEHSFSGDLDVTLTSPAGTTVLITSDNGGSEDDVFDGTTFDDQANPDGSVPYQTNAGLLSDHPYSNNQVATPLTPEQALVAFRGEDPNGTWTLAVADDAASDLGELTAFSLRVVAMDDAITATSTTFENDTVVPIPNSVTTVSSTIDVANQTDPVCDVDVITDIEHTWAGDLDVTLTSPDGTSVTLTTDNGAGNDDVFNGTRWDDDAEIGVLDATYENATVLTTLSPEEPLAAFTGDTANGTWTLSVSDDSGGDEGSLEGWQLILKTCRATDADSDGKADSCDNCPAVANAGQQDRDSDGTGDACDCGDGWVAQGEECDDGNTDDGDGCDSTCAEEATGGGGESGGGGEGGQSVGSGGSAGRSTGGTGGGIGMTAGEGGEGGESGAGQTTGGGAGRGGSAGSSAGRGGSGATGGTGNAGSGGRRPSETSKSEASCSCRVPAGSSAPSSAWLFTGLAVAFAALRRRRRG